MSLVLEFIVYGIMDLFFFGGYGALDELREERRLHHGCQRRESVQRDKSLNQR